ncbi:MAG: hypothetical protein ACHBN1_31840 [Heteroscytonema crispum UTEX LB 1556]
MKTDPIRDRLSLNYEFSTTRAIANWMSPSFLASKGIRTDLHNSWEYDCI